MNGFKILISHPHTDASPFKEALEELLANETAVLDPEDAEGLAEALVDQLGESITIDEPVDIATVDFAEVEQRCVAHLAEALGELVDLINAEGGVLLEVPMTREETVSALLRRRELYPILARLKTVS